MISKEDISELYQRVCCELPPYIIDALRGAKDSEDENNFHALDTLDSMLENAALAKKNKMPICQDTGIPKLLVNLPKGYSQNEIKEIICQGISVGTKEAYARQSGVDPISNAQKGNEGIATFYFNEWENKYLELSLLLKGGGSENAGMLFSLPNQELLAYRDIDGIKKCISYALKKNAINACPPLIVSVGIGGTRDKAIETSQRLLFRQFGERNRDSSLSLLENELIEECNYLGIGAAGLGGRTTVLDVRVDTLPRHIATFFVDVTMNCWVYRMGNLTYKNGAAEFFW